jgi:hypothetical protein
MLVKIKLSLLKRYPPSNAAKLYYKVIVAPRVLRRFIARCILKFRYHFVSMNNRRLIHELNDVLFSKHYTATDKDAIRAYWRSKSREGRLGSKSPPYNTHTTQFLNAHLEWLEYNTFIWNNAKVRRSQIYNTKYSLF